eukprot:4232746-Alexandrium_andersonii.AAC.1
MFGLGLRLQVQLIENVGGGMYERLSEASCRSAYESRSAASTSPSPWTTRATSMSRRTGSASG